MPNPLLILEYILHIRSVNAPCFMHPPRKLIEIVGGIPQQRHQLPQLRQIELHHIAVNGHFPKICAHVRRAELRHPLTADEIKAEAARLLGKLQEPVQPNSPGGTHFIAEVSRDFMERAGTKDTAALQKLLPFSTLALTTLKDRRGVFALIGKDEDRSQSLRRPSVRSKLQQASAEQKPSAAKKKDLEL